MKRKILALLAAILCISMLLVSCNKECTEHVDEDANGLCDKCEATIEPAGDDTGDKDDEGEKVVDMVVNPIPENVSPTEFLSTVYGSSADLLAGVTEFAFEDMVDWYFVEKDSYENQDGSAVITDEILILAFADVKEVETEKLSNPDDPNSPKVLDYVTYTVTYSVYDVVNDKTVTLTSFTYKSNDKFQMDADISLEDGYFVYSVYTDYDESLLTEEEEDTLKDSEAHEFYTYAGTKIAASDEDIEFGGESVENGILYLDVDGVTYAVDVKTGALLTSANSDVFVKRPAFHHVNGNYGYIVMNDDMWNQPAKVCVYDLTKWIECVYVYNLPSSMNAMSNVFYLANGNILVQTMEMLENDAVNYDVLMQGMKMDMVYTIVDLATKTAKEVEFGYYIAQVYNKSYLETDYMLENVHNKLYTDKAENVISVIAIKDRRLTTEALNLFTDNELNIKYNMDTGINGQTGVLTLVAEGYYAVEITYAEGTSVYAVVDKDFKFITYLPENYQLPTGVEHLVVGPNMEWNYMTHDGFLVIDGERVYTYDMSLKMDLADEECKYELVYSGYSYLVLKTVVTDEETLVTTETYYYYNPVKGEPVAITGKDVTLVEYGYAYYMTETAVTNAETNVTTYTYTVYNGMNEKVATFEADQNGVDIEQMLDGYYYISVTKTVVTENVPETTTTHYIAK